MIDHKNFIIQQKINTDNLDYSLFDNYKTILTELDTLGNEFYWMFDYASTRFYYLTENTSVFPNRKLINEPGLGYQCLIDNVHPDDALYMLDNQKDAFKFLEHKKDEDKLDYKFIFKVRLLSGCGNYIAYNFQIKIIRLVDSGKIWMSLGKGVVSKSGIPFHPMIISKISSNEIYNFSLKQKGAKNSFELPDLTKREKEIISLLAKNKSSEEIIIMLQISESTLKFHRKNILKKLNAPNCSTAIENACLIGLIEF